MNRMTRKETAAEVLRIISLLPSKELIVGTFVDFEIEGLKPGDCRFCVKGAVQTFTGYRELTRNDKGVYHDYEFPGGFFLLSAYDRFNSDVLCEVEDAMFDADRGHSEYTVRGRRELFRAAVRKCREIIAE